MTVIYRGNLFYNMGSWRKFYKSKIVVLRLLKLCFLRHWKPASALNIFWMCKNTPKDFRKQLKVRKMLQESLNQNSAFVV